MGCDFTEEVSLLVDGELPPHEAARLRGHIECCAVCKQACEAFLLLRQELRSYEWTPDPNAQSKALAAILDSRTPTGEMAAPSHGRVSGWFGSLVEVFGARGPRLAHVVALALLLIATALGLRWFMGSHTPSRTTQTEAPVAANTKGQPVRSEAASEDGEKKSDNSDSVNSPTILQTKPPKPPRPTGVKPRPRVEGESAQVRRDYRTGRRTLEGLSRDSTHEVARVATNTPQPSRTNTASPYAAVSLRAAAADPAMRIGRHAERVERLLRSFRNARLNDSDPTLDLTDARRLSKRLLYSNIALRRESAGAGDLSAEGWLDSLEPILLDISNLPDKPSPAAVGSIKERIRRRHLVGVLQAQAMSTSMSTSRP
jgi:hypothetical protein